METLAQNCAKCQNEFILDKDDMSFYKKMKVPNPKVCPDCRFKMRAIFRNEMSLYSGRDCDMCGKSIISIYNPKSPYTVYCHDCFYSDKWDAQNYGIKYDENRPFFDQLKELSLKVPKTTTYISRGMGPSVGTNYANMCGGCKNCYLIFNTTHTEDTMYSRGLMNVKESSDLYFCKDSELCYESLNVQESSKVFWSKNVVGCVDCSFILNGRNLVNCFGCVNLNNKSYHFLNQPLSPEDYLKKVSEITGSYSKMEEFKKEFNEFSLNVPVRENNNVNVQDSSGDYLADCKNIKDSFEVDDGENCKYLYSAKKVKDSMDVIGSGIQAEKLLGVVATGYCNGAIGCWGVEHSVDILYSFFLANCQDCLGCDGLKNKKYSILNKQYSKEEYEVLKNQIIQELISQDLHGLMIPPSLSPFAYNETVAQDNFPLTKEGAENLGLSWEDDIQKTEGKETMQPEDIPDNISDVNDSIIQEVFRCIDCNRNYKVIESEISFYRKMKIPLPRKCFYCRHRDRVVRRGPYKFWDRNCAKCLNPIRTNYSPERKEIVYCEKCYQQEVY